MNQAWWMSSVIYQIYPLSFKDTNNNGKGDLKGVIEKLDYLKGGKDSLGVDAIWLSPIYLSPLADWGYDVSDYFAIDPVFGNMADFDHLLNKAHKKDIKVLMDFIPNHSSDQHEWFKESRSSKDNPKRDWYIWRDPNKNGDPPNNWVSVFGGTAWELDEKTGQYYLHTYLKDQPDLNWRNHEVPKKMQEVMRFWLDKGVDGFRTDSISHLYKDPKFRNEPPNPKYRPGVDNQYDSLLHIYTRDLKEDLIPSINNFCSILGEQRGRLLVGEMHAGMTPDELVKLQQVCQKNLHLPFNFNLIGLAWDARVYKEFIDEYDEKHGTEAWPNYVLGNHDQPRVASRVGVEQARVAATLLLTMRGTPFIYYGEELGMQNTNISEDEVRDYWRMRDPERTPMQWNNQKGAGFTEGEAWLPISDNYQKINVETQMQDSQSMLNLYRKLLSYRKKSKTLTHGRYIPVDSDSPHAFVYLRESDEGLILVALNFSNKKRKVLTNMDQTQAKVVLSTRLDMATNKTINPQYFQLRPNEGLIMEVS